jgi:hypothetical protein
MKRNFYPFPFLDQFWVWHQQSMPLELSKNWILSRGRLFGNESPNGTSESIKAGPFLVRENIFEFFERVSLS